MVKKNDQSKKEWDDFFKELSKEDRNYWCSNPDTNFVRLIKGKVELLYVDKSNVFLNKNTLDLEKNCSE